MDVEEEAGVFWGFRQVAPSKEGATTQGGEEMPSVVCWPGTVRFGPCTTGLALWEGICQSPWNR